MINQYENDSSNIGSSNDSKTENTNVQTRIVKPKREYTLQLQNPPKNDSAVEDRLCTSLPCSNSHDSSSNSLDNNSSVNPPLSSVNDNGSHFCDAEIRITIFTRRDQLNWTNREEILGNQELFDEANQKWFEVAEAKRRYYSDAFDKGNYFDNLLLLTSANHIHAETMLYCGSNHGNHSRACHKWLFCSKCAYWESRNAMKKYKDLLHETPCMFITCSFKGSIPISVIDSCTSRIYWAAANKAIGELINEGFINGAFLTHEIKIISLLPSQILPHTHGIITVDHFNPDIAQLIHEKLVNDPTIALVPSIEVSEIETDADLNRLFTYCTKAIELTEPYTSAWIKHNMDNDRSKAMNLNLQLSNCLDAISACCSDYPRIKHMGNLMIQRSSYVGIKSTVTRKKKRKRKKPKYSSTSGFKRKAR